MAASMLLGTSCGTSAARVCAGSQATPLRAAPSPRFAAGAGCSVSGTRPVIAVTPRTHSVRRAGVAVGAAAAEYGPVVVIDNYDSFTYNLCQYLGDLGCEYVVFKNDEKTVQELRDMNPRGILLSPGPGAPEDSGITLEVCKELGPSIPLFGVCMGHQCIGQAFGGDIIRAPCGVLHGKSSLVTHENTSLLEGLPVPFKAARYHSLVIDKDTCPDVLEVTAWTDDGTIMGVRHKEYPHIQGVQFHPESIITESGHTIVQNFINSLLG